jgi:hypothetical protein
MSEAVEMVVTLDWSTILAVANVVVWSIYALMVLFDLP